MSAALTLAALAGCGAELRAEPGGLRVRGPRPLSGELRARVSRVAPLLLRVASGAWRQDLDGWPAWRIELFTRLVARQLGDLSPEVAAPVAYLEALEALPEPSNEGAKREVPPLPAPGVDLEQLEERPPTPPGFQHRYRPPPEHRALPPFRWSTLPPTTRRPAQPSVVAPSAVVESPAEPPAGPVHGPQELPKRRAARFGYRIDAHGSWLEPGEASRAPHLARFSLGHEPSEAEEEARRAQLAAIKADCLARLGPRRG